MALVLWDKDGTLLIKYLTKGGSINAEYYMSLLDELKKKKNSGPQTPWEALQRYPVFARQCSLAHSTQNSAENS